MKIIIAGSRNINNYEWIKQQTNLMLTYHWDINTEIVSGGAYGVDKLGEKYAKEKNFKLTVFPADWEAHGKRAGYKRNEEMARYADILIAFWDGESKGTKHMIDLAIRHRLETHVFIEDK